MKLDWPHVVIVIIVVAGMVTLAALGRDTTAFIGLAIAILLGAGLVQQGEIKNAANGTSARMVALMETMTKMLAQTTPMPPSSLPSVPSVTTDEAHQD